MTTQQIVNRIIEIERQLERLQTLEHMTRVVAVYETNAGQTITNASFQVINYEDMVYDTHSAVTTGASWVFTAPFAGFYRVSAAVLFAQTTIWAEHERLLLGLYVNTALFGYMCSINGLDSSGSTAWKGANGSMVVSLDKGDNINIQVYQECGASLALHTDQNYNHVSIIKVG